MAPSKALLSTCVLVWACGALGCGGGRAAEGGDAASTDAMGQDAGPTACLGDVCQPQVLASIPYGGHGIAVDSTSVYVAVGGTVTKVPLDGGTAVTLAGMQPTPLFVAVDSTSVYWTNSIVSTSVAKVALDGGSEVILASNQPMPQGLAVDSTSVYWSNGGNGTVMKVPLDGGAPTVLATGQTGAYCVAVDAISVYWSNSVMGGAVMKVALEGGNPVTLAVVPDLQPMGIALEGANVYWVTRAFGAATPAVMGVSVDGGTPVTLGGPNGYFNYITADETGVYFSDLESVSWLPLDANEVYGRTLAVGLTGEPQGIAVDTGNIYWINYDGTIMKMPKRYR